MVAEELSQLHDVLPGRPQASAPLLALRGVPELCLGAKISLRRHFTALIVGPVFRFSKHLQHFERRITPPAWF